MLYLSYYTMVMAASSPIGALRFDRLFLLLISTAFVRVKSHATNPVSDPMAIRNLITDAGLTTNYRPSELLRRYHRSRHARSYRMEAFSGWGNAFSMYLREWKPCDNGSLTAVARMFWHGSTRRGQIFSPKPKEALSRTQ